MSLKGKEALHMYQIGIDIGGTNVKIGLLDEALDGIDESNSKRIDKYDIYYTGDMAKWRGWATRSN